MKSSDYKSSLKSQVTHRIRKGVDMSFGLKMHDQEIERIRDLENDEINMVSGGIGRRVKLPPKHTSNPPLPGDGGSNRKGSFGTFSPEAGFSDVPWLFT